MNISALIKGNKFYFHEIIGFAMIYSVYGAIGKITGMNDTASQALFEVQKGGKQFLIPVSNEIIGEVNREIKTIFVTTPDGLVNLYLE
ncbi:MAG: 16S rRNA processing protein RimM [Maribacter sp.]|jgi:16S rRNA processing protein RimM|tara:strand:- start:614 stop:877 length:264 start_codon:yes stop_codon:yes gene_type:complete